MDNRIINVEKCTDYEIEHCKHQASKRKWRDGILCQMIRPIDCPKIEEVCDGEPCLAGTVVDTNADPIEFPCSGCKRPTKREQYENTQRMIREMGGSIL